MHCDLESLHPTDLTYVAVLIFVGNNVQIDGTKCKMTTMCQSLIFESSFTQHYQTKLRFRKRTAYDCLAMITPSCSFLLSCFRPGSSLLLVVVCFFVARQRCFTLDMDVVT
jgi:hypothetical protein